MYVCMYIHTYIQLYCEHSSSPSAQCLNAAPRVMLLLRLDLTYATKLKLGFLLCKTPIKLLKCEGKFYDT